MRRTPDGQLRHPETSVIVVAEDEKIIPTCKRIQHIRDRRAQEENAVGVDAASCGN